MDTRGKEKGVVLGHRPDKRMIGQTIWTVRSNSWNIQRVCVAKGHELTRATSDQRVQVPKGCNPDGLGPLLGCMDPSLGPDQSGLGRLFYDSLDRGTEADRSKAKEP
ncbi:hypothetical protein F2Q68_00019981 [Brassica cretica]|uniref:Uncharacterized protein n=1 Tax=Brassica cretica TaxID=69181 RepID=A0A8S9FTK0_BRACR|nr:hypothetical protein F2Q68_00019981 [Brassica cretica]